MTGVRADVDVDESLTGRSLHDWTKKSWDEILTAGLYSYREFEVKVFRFRSLLLDRLIFAAPAFLQTKVHISRRFLQNNPKRQFAFHAFPNQSNAAHLDFTLRLQSIGAFSYSAFRASRTPPVRGKG